MYKAGLVIFAQIMYKTVILMLPPVQRNIVPLKNKIYILYIYIYSCFIMNRPKPLLPLKSTCVYKCTTSFLFEFIETTTTKKKRLYFGECRFFSRQHMLMN